MKNQEKTAVDILAFSPHPDDVELGCGGSLISMTNKGLRVAVADMTAGEMSSRGTLEQRVRETEEASRLLGLSARLSLGLPDTKIGARPDHRQAVIRLIRETRPHIVLAPHWQDRHPDHRAAGILVRDACFYAGVSKMDSQPAHRPTELYYYMIHSPFEPSFVMDVSDVWDERMAAIQAYSSQFKWGDNQPDTALSRPDFLRFVEARAVWFGAMIGTAYGEPFFSQGPVALDIFPGVSNPGEPETPFPVYRSIG